MSEKLLQFEIQGQTVGRQRKFQKATAWTHPFLTVCVYEESPMLYCLYLNRGVFSYNFLCVSAVWTEFTWIVLLSVTHAGAVRCQVGWRAAYSRVPSARLARACSTQLHPSQASHNFFTSCWKSYPAAPESKMEHTSVYIMLAGVPLEHQSSSHGPVQYQLAQDCREA